jgi:hypothetical protein
MMMKGNEGYKRREKREEKRETEMNGGTSKWEMMPVSVFTCVSVISIVDKLVHSLRFLIWVAPHKI